jgi:hypothetical protein
VADVTTAVIDSTENEQGLPSCLDTLVVEHRCAPAIDNAVLEIALPVGSAPSGHEDIRPKRQPGYLDARWIPDPLGEQGLICIWVHRTGEEASAPGSILDSGQFATRGSPK